MELKKMPIFSVFLVDISCIWIMLKKKYWISKILTISLLQLGTCSLLFWIVHSHELSSYFVWAWNVLLVLCSWKLNTDYHQKDMKDDAASNYFTCSVLRTALAASCFCWRLPFNIKKTKTKQQTLERNAHILQMPMIGTCLQVKGNTATASEPWHVL